MEVLPVKQHRSLQTREYVALAFLAASITFYILGLCYPLMSTKYQVLGFQIRSQEVTLFDSVRMFWESSDYLISGIILIFTFIFPVKGVNNMSHLLF